ncbi:MAG: GAF domain-containing protein [Fimbriimonadales bacterium]
MISCADADRIVALVTASHLAGAELRKLTMQALDRLPGYDWCGVYRLEGDDLMLDAFVGEETDHTRISVGVGVCGTAVAENSNQVIPDVRGLSNYLSCSVQTRSEIVVLIRHAGEVLGQIDVDGHEVGAFDTSDEAFLERLAEILARRWE